MELKIHNGDYVRGDGRIVRLEGREALLQRVLFKLTARRGTFPFLPELGSRLYLLGRVSGGARQSAAEQYVAEALSDEKELEVETVTLLGNNRLRVELRGAEERFSMEVTVGE